MFDFPAAAAWAGETHQVYLVVIAKDYRASGAFAHGGADRAGDVRLAGDVSGPRVDRPSTIIRRRRQGTSP